MNSLVEQIVGQCLECQVTTKQYKQEPFKVTTIPEDSTEEEDWRVEKILRETKEEKESSPQPADVEKEERDQKTTDCSPPQRSEGKTPTPP
jgi:hypothetical protein